MQHLRITGCEGRRMRGCQDSGRLAKRNICLFFTLIELIKSAKSLTIYIYELISLFAQRNPALAD